MDDEQEEFDKNIVTLNPPTVATHPKTILFIFWLSTMAVVAVLWSFYFLVLQAPWMVWLVPLEILASAFIFIFTSFFLVKIAIIILEKKCPPREGIFPVDGKEMRYYQARHFFKYYALWLARNATFPWIDKIAYTMFGVPVGKTVVLHEAWVDTEFVEIGDFAMVGMGSTVMSHCIYKDKFLVRRVIIESHTVIGAYTILAPGVKVGMSSVMGANSGTHIDQDIAPGHLYAGNPAKKLKEIK
ncbi:MAG: acyltransferase [Promethearchaeota archaeon]